MLAQRRVRRLALKADDDSSLQLAMPLLEDALRTASFPGLPQHGVVFIRKLALGAIQHQHNAAGYASRIDQLLLSIRPLVISPGQEEQPQAQAVWFSDAIEPFVLLAGLLVKGSVPSSWYWPLAVPGWQLQSQTNVEVKQVLSLAAQQANSMQIQSAILHGLLEDGSLDVLLESLSVTDMALLGVSSHVSAAPSHASTQAVNENLQHVRASAWPATLQQWIPRWGQTDRRSQWLASHALRDLHIKPDALLIDALMEQSLVTDISFGPDQALMHPTLQNTDASAGVPVDGFTQWQTTLTPQSLTRPGTDVVTSHGQPGQLAARSSDMPARNHDYGGEYCEASGFLFLINVLNRLGMETTLTQYPLLAEACLPFHILNHCQARLGIAVGHKLSDFIATALSDTAYRDSQLEYVVPQWWLQMLLPGQRRNRFNLLTRNGQSGRQLLCDASGKMVLALWRGGMPQAVACLIQDGVVSRQTHWTQQTDMELMVQSYWFAIRRFLWRGLRWHPRRLVLRNGILAVSRTHLDVSLPLQQCDIDIRKNGLDIDPGWVPWLRRVVQFHYLELEE